MGQAKKSTATGCLVLDCARLWKWDVSIRLVFDMDESYLGRSHSGTLSNSSFVALR